jgi:2,3-dihydroxy-p-cumate/2,3-dihydroxybenzoate 3,4-dioxygenase
MRYRKLGYVALNVSDTGKSRRFYEDLVGLNYVGEGARGEVFFRCSFDHHNIVLYPSDAPGLKRVGWEMEDDGALDQAFAVLSEAGAAPHWLSDEECADLHQDRTFRASLPYSGVTFEYYNAMKALAGEPFIPTVTKIDRLGHLLVKVPDFNRAQAFVTETLDFQTSDFVSGRMSWLRCFPNPLHHVFGFGKADNLGLHHVNFMVEDMDDIGKAMYRLRNADVPIVFGPGRHPPSGSIFLYFLDPDELTLEFSSGMEEFSEMSPRKPRSLEATPESFDYWGATRDPRQAAKGSVEILGS